MIEELVKRIPQSMLKLPGGALHTGRQAFDSPAEIYIIGYHPGGNPAESTETVGEQIHRVINRKPDAWSAYLDDSWDGKPRGSQRMQRRVAHLCAGLGLDLRAIPSSHLIFPCWDAGSEPGAAVERQWAEECWSFHQAVIDRLEIRIVVCLGSYARDWALKKERERTGVMPEPVDKFVADNKWAWRSYVYPAGDRYIVSLTHPVWSNWINPTADPTPLVRRVLAEVRGG